jgi:hypothetical protein
MVGWPTYLPETAMLKELLLDIRVRLDYGRST